MTKEARYGPDSTSDGQALSIGTVSMEQRDGSTKHEVGLISIASAR